MLKKLLMAVFAITMLSTSVYAADITIQGEDYDRIYTNTEVSLLPADGEDKTLVISQWKSPTMEYTVEYDFDIETAGGYELIADVSHIDSAYTSNFYYSVNGGEYIYSGDVFKKISESDSSFGSDSMNVYSLGIVELKSGTNTIKFMINELRESTISTQNWTVFYINYFTFTKQDFGFSSVTPSKPSFVFEPSDNIEFTVNFADYPSENKTYTVIVEDYFHNVVKKSSFELSKNAMRSSLNFGKLTAGWYRILISDGAEVIYNSGFSVVHDMTQRKENPHFAIDFAGMALTTGKTEVSNLSRALKLAGINMVRERYYWANSETAYKYNNETVASAGLDVINMFCDTPSDLVSGGYMADDLFEVYNFQKGYAEKYGGLVDYMEVWNEEDTSFATETADRYSAFLKAAAIGITDGNADMGVSHGGFANSPADTRYMDFCMMNDFMEYSDLYNYHAYASGGNEYTKTPSLNFEEIGQNRDILTAYGYDNRRSWVTEGGISITTIEDRSRSQQARASVINNVQSVASGNDKHFLFVVPQYYESGREFGIFCEDKTPSPAYSSLENFTYVMGEGNYKGIFRDLAENSCGYLFNNGENDVGVFWCETGESFVQVATDAKAKLVDLMGNEKEVQPINGIISIPITMDPCYLIFEETIGTEYYAGFKKVQPEYERIDISDNKKIVIQQTFEDRSYADERNKGYLIYKGEDNICTLTVYNFSDKEQTGVINAKISDNFTIDKTQQSVTIPPMGKTDITFKVRVANGVTGSEKGFLQFSGVMNGEEITKSTSVIRCRIQDNISTAGTFSNSKSSNNWNKSGATSSGSVSVSNEGYFWNPTGVKFDVKLDGNGWCYPNFKVKSSEISSLKDSTGIRFTVTADEDVGQAIMHCFVYLDDASVKYFEGNANGKTIKAGSTDYYFPWDEMVLQYVKEGVDSTFAFDRITHIAIGVNLSGTKTAKYTLKNIGWYKDNKDNDIQSWDTLEISGEENGAVFYKGTAPVVSAKLPETEEINSVKVYLSGCEYDDYTENNDTVSIDLSELDTGIYTLLVTAENDFGYIYRDSLDFIIQ